MAIVTLTSDLGLQDFYLAAAKGALLSVDSDINIVDITHQVPNFDIFKAAEIIKHSYFYFPKNTIHCVAVNNDSIHKSNLLVAHYNGHYFIGPDNGLFSFLFDTKPEEIVRVKMVDENRKSTFPLLHSYVPVVKNILQGLPLTTNGEVTDVYVEKNPLRAFTNEDIIKGYIWHTDIFGNAITNISKEIFDKIGKGQKCKITVKREEYNLIHQHYDDRKNGEAVLFFNHLNMLEIAIYNGSALQLLGIQRNERVTIQFGSLID
jgi:hypothetical protein